MPGRFIEVHRNTPRLAPAEAVKGLPMRKFVITNL